VRFHAACANGDAPLVSRLMRLGKKKQHNEVSTFFFVLPWTTSSPR
jgi:ankyrin repeat protein